MADCLIRSLFNVLQTLELLCGKIRIGLSGSNLRLGLRHLFGPGAVLQPQQGLLLYANLRFGLCDLQHQGASIERGQHLSGLHTVAFLHAHVGHPLAAVESQRNLADIDVAKEHQCIGIALLPVKIPPCQHRGGDDQSCGGYDKSFIHEWMDCYAIARRIRAIR